MTALSRLSKVPSFVQTVLSAYLISKSLRSWKGPATVARLVVALSLLNTVRTLIYNKYFHPLSHIPGGFTSLSNFYTALGTSIGRSHEFTPQAHKRFGKVVRVAPNIISVADKNAIRDILVTTDYPKSEIHEAIELSDQHNLFSSRNKDFHKNRRRLVAPAFGISYLRSLEPLMQVLIRKLDEVLAAPDSVPQATVLPKGQANICSFLNRLSLDIIGETVFGQTFQMVLHDDHPVPKLLAKSLKRSQQQTFNPLLRWLVPVDRSFLIFGAERVQMRKEAGEAGRRADLLQYLIDAQAKEREDGNGETGDEYQDMISGKLTDKALESEAFLFLAAGSDTSSTAMTHTLMFLVKNPETLAKLREEMDLATAGNPKGFLPSYDQVRGLEYLTACINESMRLRTVAATGIPREVPEDTTMAGIFVPAGTIVLASTPSLHLSDEYFPQADQYIPERWIPEESPFPPVQEFTFYPFSAGTRNCVGKNFAMMEMRLVLAAIITHYDIKDVPGQRTDYVQFITTALATGSYVLEMNKRT
ncbi:hypothetical protein BG005_010151 [Podila minutissima]|nr:hypothetical protein BG005_010151 [Podila minutissima]